MSTSLDAADSGVHCHIQVDTKRRPPIFHTRVQWELEGREHVEEAEHTDLVTALEWLDHTLRQQVGVCFEQWELVARRVKKPFLQDRIYFIRDPSQMAQVNALNEEETRRRLNEVYKLVQMLPRFDHSVTSKELPDSGIYFFFEDGETVEWNSRQTDRIVRIGTHRKDGGLPGRIHQHFGAIKSLKGNKNDSVFRKHVGGALLRRDNPDDPRLVPWLAQGGPSDLETEMAVSRELRERFTLRCVRVDDKADRLRLEEGLIGLLSRNWLAPPSSEWLGWHADHKAIIGSGLWNVQHTRAPAIFGPDLLYLRQLIEASS